MFLDVIPAALTERSIDSSVSALSRLLTKLADYAFVLSGKIVVAILIFFIGKFFISRIRKLLAKVLLRKKLDETIRTFLDSFINISLKIFMGVVIVGQLGIQTTSFAAMIAAAGLAIGMAMKDNLSNFAGGVMILFNRPFKVKDRILAQGQDGVVQSIGILYTVLLTPDNRTLYIPNGPLSTGNIVNYSTQGTRRLDVLLSFGNGADLANIKAIIHEIISQETRILSDPQPVVELSALQNGGIEIAARVWVNTVDYALVNRYLNENIYREFVSRGIYAPAVTTVKISQ
ncbi:MAG: hypothetical protein BGN96_07185 [Bacteroidales bacterium 45-6]|nr:MAG: hypothetical protein BGN96_07185 [Bacteroidales bacterium 45-6]